MRRLTVTRTGPLRCLAGVDGQTDEIEADLGASCPASTSSDCPPPRCTSRGDRERAAGVSSGRVWPYIVLLRNVGSGIDLADDEPSGGDQVERAVATPPGAGQKHEIPMLDVARREVLTGVPDHVLGCHTDHADRLRANSIMVAIRQRPGRTYP
jgi:hypothetical protein